MSKSNIYRMPHPSRASRKVVTRSRASLRGFLIAMLPAFRWPRELHFESELEYRFLCLMLIRDDIFDIWDQPTAIKYVGRDGRPASHTFDFLVTKTDGTKIAVAIKPSGRAVSIGFVEDLELVEQATPKQFADQTILVTENQLNRKAARAAARKLAQSRPSLVEEAA